MSLRTVKNFRQEEGDKVDQLYSQTVGPTNSGADYECDGDKDNVQIQQAIDDVSDAGGGNVHILNGTYVGQTLVIKDNVMVTGEGDGTIYTYEESDWDPTNDYGIKINGSNCGIMNMKIDGTLRRRTGFGRVRGIDIRAEANNDELKNITVKNLTLIKLKRGVTVNIGVDGYTNTLASDIYISNIKMYNTREAGSCSIFDSSDTQSTQVGRNIIFDGLQWSWIADSDDLTGTGEEVFDFNKAENCTVVNSSFIADSTFYLTDEAIDLGGYHKNCKFINNTLIGNFRRSIKCMNNARDTKIMNNYCEFISGTKDAYWGIAIETNESAVGDYLGYYANAAALNAAHPTGSANQFAHVGDTDTIYYWSGSAWTDSGEPFRPVGTVCTGNTVKGYTNGIALKGCKFSVVSNNHVEACARGILLIDSTSYEIAYNVVSNNTIRNLTTVGASNTAEGIHLYDNAVYNTITGNVIVDDRSSTEMTYGIREISTCDYNMITNNMVYGVTIATVQTIGASTLNKDNIPENVAQRTATTTGSGTGTLLYGSKFVQVTSDDANKVIVLPAPVVGTEIWLRNGATGYELRSSDPTTIAINGGTGAGAESAIAANTLVRMVCDTTTTWIGTQFATDGTESKVEAAA